jgi:hypothetical protein
MSLPEQSSASSEAIDLLSKLLLSHGVCGSSEIGAPSEMERLQRFNPELFDSLVALAHSNHVVIRGMEVYRTMLRAVNDYEGVRRAEEVIAAERLRIASALAHLRLICDAFAGAGFDAIIIKTLDHWPDFGSDIDLYTNADPAAVCALMQRTFDATMSSRSWGDRLAGKWNFEVPGLRELVEIHMGRLGQTGEQLTLARNIPARSRVLRFDDYEFQVSSASDRIMISTLQRMYRHFYFRLCDIVDSASLVTSSSLDWDDLRHSAEACGIWEGTATYLVLVSDYVDRYSGSGIALPAFVKRAARFDGTVMHSGGSFLRVPIMPQSAGLYWSQLLGSLRRGEMHSSARLGILPWLATSAAIGQKLTGGDKGIW